MIRRTTFVALCDRVFFLRMDLQSFRFLIHRSRMQPQSAVSRNAEKNQKQRSQTPVLDVSVQVKRSDREVLGEIINTKLATRNMKP